MNRLPPVFPARRKPLFPFYHPRRAARGCGISLALASEHRPNSSLHPGTGLHPFCCARAQRPRRRAPFLSICYNGRRQTTASRADADVYARMRCVACNPCWTYIWNAWKRGRQPTSGYGYLVDEAIRCMEGRLHKNSLVVAGGFRLCAFSSFSYNSPVSGFLMLLGLECLHFHQIMKECQKFNL